MTTSRIFTLVGFCISFCLFSCNKAIQQLDQEVSTPSQPPIQPPTPAQNIILLIGDGMGLTQMSTAYYYGEDTPSFSRFKYIGLHQNAPIGKKITDSASGATAFSTGYKSFNSAIGVDKDSISRETILEWAEKNQKSTGLIATSSITHATPASFYAHVDNRGLAEDIALDYTKLKIDFAAGGGYKYFNQRADGRNLFNEMKSKGVEIDTNAIGNNFLPGNQYAYFLAPDAMPKMLDGRGDFLTDATAAALKHLSTNDQGFFLMVEGSQIDWGGHNNDADYLISELLDFDKAVDLALDFADKNENTLVIVTADHETGGLSLSAAKVFGKDDYGALKATFSTGGHSAALIPVYAYGNGAEDFIGIYQNNELFFKMMRAFGVNR